MKKSFILGTLLLSAANTSFALQMVELHPVRVLVEHVKEIPKTHLGTKGAMCTASANAASGTAGQMITVNGYITYSVSNNTTVSQNYWIDEYMCVNGFGCTHTRDTLVLGPHLGGNGGGAIANMEMLPKGTYVDQSTVQVAGESTCFAQGSNSVHVS